MPSIRLDSSTASHSPSYSSYLPTHTSQHPPPKRGSISQNLTSSKRYRALSLLCLVLLCFLIFSHSSSTPPTPSSVTSLRRANAAAAAAKKGGGGGGFLARMFGASPEIVLQEPEGEYDPHGLGEGSYDPYGSVEMGGNIDDQKEMEERMGLLVVDKNEEEEQDAVMTPSALRQQLIALTAFLVDGGVLPASPPLDTSRLITLSYLRRHNAALASPSPPTSDNKSGEEKGMIAGNGGQKKLAQLPTGNGWAEYVEKRYPLLIFSKSYCPYSRKAKSLISALRPTPSPLILEVDRRPDAAPLKNLLGHLTGRSTFPNVILNFEPLGGGDDIALLAAEGGLANVLKDKGMKMGRLGGAM